MQIFAGIVLYNPDCERLKESLDSIASQVSRVILVDNGSKNIKEVIESLLSYDNTLLVKNAENQGIATALNQICKTACDNGAKWVLTLDQDTVCPTDIISKLAAHCNEYNIGIVCPAVNYEGANIRQKNIDAETVDVYACMTSGSLTNLDAWRKVGGFRDSYFIDYVDNEYCMRLGVAGYRIMRVNGSVMRHQLGEPTKMKLFNLFPVIVTRHNPWRYYYMTRNNLLFIWQYRKHLNLIREYGKITSILYHGILYSDKRRVTASYIWRGIKDAFKKKEGIYQE